VNSLRGSSRGRYGQLSLLAVGLALVFTCLSALPAPASAATVSCNGKLSSDKSHHSENALTYGVTCSEDMLGYTIVSNRELAYFSTEVTVMKGQEVAEGDTVVVFGAGPVGLFAAKSAWFFGAGRVIVVDCEDYRLEFAKKFAHAETVNFREVDDVATHLKKITDWLGADVSIDAVGCDATGSAFHGITGKILMLQAGSPIALHWAINSARKGGRISIVGVYGPTFNMIPIGNAVNKGLTLRMNQASVKRHLPRLIEHIRAGHISPREVITHRIPLEDVADAYDIFVNKRDNCIKTVLVPPSARAEA